MTDGTPVVPTEQSAPVVGVETAPAQSVATSGAPLRTTGSERDRGSSRQTAPAGAAPVVRTDRTAFDRRVAGATAGTVSRAGRQVFAPSTPRSSKARKASPTKRAAAPSTRAATADLWSGFRTGERASVLSAAASAPSEGTDGTMIAAIAGLGLGLAGIAGAMAMMALRSRRSKSRSAAK